MMYYSIGIAIFLIMAIVGLWGFVEHEDEAMMGRFGTPDAFALVGKIGGVGMLVCGVLALLSL